MSVHASRFACHLAALIAGGLTVGAVCSPDGLGLLAHETMLERRLRRFEAAELYRHEMTRWEGPAALSRDRPLAG